VARTAAGSGPTGPAPPASTIPLPAELGPAQLAITIPSYPPKA
jgi:hypothetical protein